MTPRSLVAVLLVLPALLIAAGPAWASPKKPKRAAQKKSSSATGRRRTLPVPAQAPAAAVQAPAAAVQAPAAAVQAPAAAVQAPAAAVQAPAAPAQTPAPAASLAPPAGATAPDLAALGAGLIENDAGLSLAEPWPESRAEELLLKPGDRLLALDRLPLHSRQDAANALRGWMPETRLSAVVRRGYEILSLQGREPETEAAFKRGLTDLAAHEWVLKERRLNTAFGEARAQMQKAPSLEFKIQARQAFWLRFVDGIREEVAPGDILLGEVTTAVATGSELDFLSIPPKSQVWAKVIDAKISRETRNLRLFLFKIRLNAGRYYPIAGWLTDIVGPNKLVKMSPGGTIVLANPLPQEGAPKHLVAPEIRLRGELLSPVALIEPPQFYQAGPGLWIKTKETEEGRRFELSHVIPGRSAEKAGLRVGQILTAINGRSTAKLDFSEALSELYGVPGTTVKVSAADGGPKPRTVELVRGVSYGKDGKALPLPPPFEK